MIEAAGNARRFALKCFPADLEAGLHVIMDCISRVLFLGAGFAEELEAVAQDNLPLVGACTIGEIANCGTELLEYFNKTAVVAVLETG